MSKVIICRGIPGSGKSTWAKEYVRNNPETIRVNLDDIRSMMNDSNYIHANNSIAKEMILQAIRSCIDRKLDIILDNTNLNEKSLKPVLNLCSTYLDIEVEYKDFFDIPLHTCIDRDSKRENPVGEEVIRSFYDKLPEQVTNQLWEKTIENLIVIKKDSSTPRCEGCFFNYGFDSITGRTKCYHVNRNQVVNCYKEYFENILVNAKE